MDDVSQAVFPRRFPVLGWAIAHVFGRDAMYWSRLAHSPGRFSVVGTTVTSPEQVPQELVGDAQQSWRKGERIWLVLNAYSVSR